MDNLLNGQTIRGVFPSVEREVSGMLKGGRFQTRNVEKFRNCANGTILFVSSYW